MPEDLCRHSQLRCLHLCRDEQEVRPQGLRWSLEALKWITSGIRKIGGGEGVRAEKLVLDLQMEARGAVMESHWQSEED